MYLYIPNFLYIPGINLTWSWCMIFTTVLSILIYSYFVENFCIIIHQRHWSLDFLFSFAQSILGISVKLSIKCTRSIPSSCIYMNDPYYMGGCSSLRVKILIAFTFTSQAFIWRGDILLWFPFCNCNQFLHISFFFLVHP